MLFRLPSEEELTDHKLNEFIAKHDAECAFRFKHLKDAYETDYQIFHQKPKPDYKQDNRIAVNFASIWWTHSMDFLSEIRLRFL